VFKQKLTDAVEYYNAENVFQNCFLLIKNQSEKQPCETRRHGKTNKEIARGKQKRADEVPQRRDDARLQWAKRIALKTILMTLYAFFMFHTENGRNRDKAILIAVNALIITMVLVSSLTFLF